MGDGELKKLAETLKSQGLAASMYEAMEKAKSIMNIKSQNSEEKQEATEKILKQEENLDINPEQQKMLNQKNELLEESDKFSSPDYDMTKEKVSLNELMQEVGVSEEQVAEQEKEKIGHIMEEVNEIREDLKEAEQNPEKADEIREEISHVNEEINEVVEERDESPEMQTEQEQSQDTSLEEPSETEEAKKESTEEESNQEEGRFVEEKNIDLTKVFNYRK